MSENFYEQTKESKKKFAEQRKKRGAGAAIKGTKFQGVF